MKSKILHLTIVLLCYTLLSTNLIDAQEVELIPSNWNIPTDICPNVTNCYREVTTDNTLYYLSVDSLQLTVIPPDGTSATIYDLSSIYPYQLNLGMAIFDDAIFMYRLNGYAAQIDIFRLDRQTGVISEWDIPAATPFTRCNTGRLLDRPFFVLDTQRAVFCSENPLRNFNIHIINIVTNTVEQTLAMGENNLEGPGLPWNTLQVGLDQNLYIRAFESTYDTLGIIAPSNYDAFHIKYDPHESIFSLSPLNIPAASFPSQSHIVIDEFGNKYIIYASGSISEPQVEIYKTDPVGQIIWASTDINISNYANIVYLLGEDNFAILGEDQYIEIVSITENSNCDSDILSGDIISLISAITTGNSAGVPYTICLENSSYTLNAVDNSNGLGANGLPVITGDITIVGNGATITRDAVAPVFRFFRVADGANLTLDGVTLSNGETSGDGGAIYNAGTLTLKNSTLTGNTAAYEGGAIYNDYGDSLTVENSSFVNNIAVNDDGGAIDNHGSLDISGSTFDGNQTQSDDGGAIWTDSNTTLTISDSSFLNNTSADDGGAIMSFGTVTITGETLFQDNTASTAGGAISADTGSIDITGGDFIRNTATNDDGGAIVSFAPVTLSDVTFDDNTSGDKGGAIYVHGTTLTIDTGSLFIRNDAPDDGGAIYTGSNSAVVNITDSTFTDNSTSQYGGALYFDKGTHNISNSTFNLNTATQRGGAIYSDANLTISGNSLFDSNQSSDDGGAIAASSTIQISNSTFTGNTASHQGGAVRVYVSSSSYLVNSCISGNTAPDTNGVYSADDDFDATANWWGAIDGPSGDGNGSGDAVNWGVDFANFVTSDCQSALNQGAGATQALLVAPSSVQSESFAVDTSIFSSERSPYNNSFDDTQALWINTVRWLQDDTHALTGQAWWIDTSVRGQTSILEMSTWIEIGNQNRQQLRFSEQAQLASTDMVTVQIQTDSSSEWTVIAQSVGGNFTWQERSIDLVDYRRQTVRLRWVIDVPADEPVGENSQYYAIDDVQITHRR